jgi:uncharacterized membrane protein YdbT with pleckstrin-like domain
MTSAGVQIALRPPAWLRAGVVLFAVSIPFFVRFLVEPGRGGGTWGIAIAFGAGAGLLAWRLLRLAAIACADGQLLVRNFWSTRRLHRDDIVIVSAERVQGSFHRSIRLQLRDGSDTRLDVTEAPVGDLGRLTDTLRSWVAGRPQPFR